MEQLQKHLGVPLKHHKILNGYYTPNELTREDKIRIQNLLKTKVPVCLWTQFFFQELSLTVGGSNLKEILEHLNSSQTQTFKGFNPEVMENIMLRLRTSKCKLAFDNKEFLFSLPVASLVEEKFLPDFVQYNGNSISIHEIIKLYEWDQIVFPKIKPQLFEYARKCHLYFKRKHNLLYNSVFKYYLSYYREEDFDQFDTIESLYEFLWNRYWVPFECAAHLRDILVPDLITIIAAYITPA